MSLLITRVVDVYPYRKRAGSGIEYLLFRRAPGRVYAGQWRIIGGKICETETAWQAALRELREETGAEPVAFWSVPSLNLFYEWQRDRVNVIPAFAAELVQDPVLNHEHDEYAWLQPDEADSRLIWPEQQRLLRLVDRMLRTGMPPELRVNLA